MTIALLLSLVSIASCQPGEGPDIFPDEHTRKLARELDLTKVKEVYISGIGREVKVTDPKVIALIVEGFKTANTTNFTNKVDYIEVTGKDGEALISYRLSLQHFPEISPEMAEGLKAAGAELPGYTEWKERAAAEQKLIDKLLLLTPVFIAVLAIFIFKDKLKSIWRPR